MPLQVTKLSIVFGVLTVLAGVSSALFIIQPEFILNLIQPKTANILGFVLGGIGGICFLAATFSSYKQQNTYNIADITGNTLTNGAGGPRSREEIELSKTRHTVPASKSESLCGKFWRSLGNYFS